MGFTTSEMQARFLGTVDKPDYKFYADPPKGIVKCYYSTGDRCGFFVISPKEFEDFKRWLEAWSSLPKSQGAQYVVFGEYPIAQEAIVQGTQYVFPGAVASDWPEQWIERGKRGV